MYIHMAKLKALFVGVLMIRALRFGAHIEAPDLGKLPMGSAESFLGTLRLQPDVRSRSESQTPGRNQ